MKTGSSDPNLLVGLESPDDAAVYRLTPEVAIVQTVDFFTPVVDEPEAWGRIAAANALSDVYAMGGVPITALNLIGWPRSLDLALLGRVLSGAGEICDQAQVAVVGGHSVDDPEPKFGLAVTGTLAPDAIVLKTGALAGAALVLTKPLGTGIISSAIKEGEAPADVVDRAVEVMTTLNRGAADAMRRVGVQAATDVTGFGLIGHLKGMLGDRLSARLSFEMIPLIEGVIELSGQGIFPGGSERNAATLSQYVDFEGVDDARRRILFDSQTSGGLLMAVAEEDVSRLMDELGAHSVSGAVVIGSVYEGDGRVVVS